MSEEIQQRLQDYSVRTANVQTQAALLDQRLAILERRTEEYHVRLHINEDKTLAIEVKQQIHDLDIKGLKKIWAGNGERESLAVDIDRLDREIKNLLAAALKHDLSRMNFDLGELAKWKEKLDSRAWALWLLVIGLIVSQIWERLFP